MTARTARSRPTLGAALGFGLAALSALALRAGPAQAAFPGSNGRVLVQWGDHIVSYAKSGGDRRDLGQGVGPGSRRMPRRSPFHSAETSK